MKRYMAVGGLMALLACGDSSGPGPVTAGTTFVIEVSGEQFRVEVSNATAIAALRQRMASGTAGVVMGRLSSGNGGFNTPWGWHLDPATVGAPDVATEVCDGRPSDVQSNISYWMGSVGSYCPWGARVIREE
jgi:hypothetical protein